VWVRGPSAPIKSRHSVGGLPERMRLELLEPLRELFKDEVRDLGRVLGVPEEIVGRQPFPGPGLAVRIIGPVDAARLAILRGADAIVQEEIRAAGRHGDLWPAFAVLASVVVQVSMGAGRNGQRMTQRISTLVLTVTLIVSAATAHADWPGGGLGKHHGKFWKKEKVREKLQMSDDEVRYLEQIFARHQGALTDLDAEVNKAKTRLDTLLGDDWADDARVL